MKKGPGVVELGSKANMMVSSNVLQSCCLSMYKQTVSVVFMDATDMKVHTCM